MRLRHPRILSFLELKQDKRGNETLFYVVTEHVKPLEAVIDKLATSRKLLGLFEVFSALNFLHKNDISHNNLKLSSIFVSYSEEGVGFKLGAVEHAQKASSMSRQELKEMDANIVPPEEKGEGTFVNKTVHVRDVWAVSLLLKEMFSEEEMSSKSFGDSLREMLSICASLNPSQRPNVASLLKHKLFASSSFIQTAEFLSNLTTMEENLKSKFFKELINKLPLSFILFAFL